MTRVTNTNHLFGNARISMRDPKEGLLACPRPLPCVSVLFLLNQVNLPDEFLLSSGFKPSLPQMWF